MSQARRPRIAGRLLRRVVDFAVVEGDGRITREIADDALTRLGVDHIGLDGADRRYLSLIAENYAGGPVGVETLSAALSEARDAIEEVIERVRSGRYRATIADSQIVNSLRPGRDLEIVDRIPVSRPIAWAVRESNQALRRAINQFLFAENVLSRGGRELADAVEGALDRGSVFDGWSDHLDLGAVCQSSCGQQPPLLAKYSQPFDRTRNDARSIRVDVLPARPFDTHRPGSIRPFCPDLRQVVSVASGKRIHALSPNCCFENLQIPPE